MKIGYVLRSLEDSGVTVYVLRLAEAMRSRGHDVFLASDGGVYAEEVRRKGFRHYPLPLCRGRLRSYLAARRLPEIVRSERPDILHGNWRRAQFACHLAGKKVGTPFVTTLHLVGIPDNWLYRRLTHWGRLVIAPCSEGVTYLRDTFGVPEDRIRLVFHGVDPEKWPPPDPQGRIAARRELSLPPDAPVAVCVARLDWVKAHEVLLAAVAEARRTVPELRVLLVGSGPEDAALKRLADRLALGETVRFLGHVDPRPSLAAADVFVLTSIKESFGFAPVEAMLSGLPVIRTASQGARDQIDDGVTGRVVPVGDARAVAGALVDLATSPDGRREMARAGREKALASFTISRMAQAVEAVYREVLAQA